MLFVDVVGSTVIGQPLGPEDIRAVMNGALERFTAVVQSRHGRVLQYTGGGLLTVGWRVTDPGGSEFLLLAKRLACDD